MITPMDIHNKTFSRGLRGYSQEEVDAFLQELASDYERIYREHREMEEEMDTVKTKLRNYEKMESTMSSTLVMAQETAENVKRNAQKEAELAVREAQNEAHHIISDAEAARRKLNTDLLKTEELSAILTKAGFTNMEIDTKLGCVTVSARRPVTALDKVKTAVRFDNVRKWGRAALFAAGTAAAVCTAACLLKKNKKQ